MSGTYCFEGSVTADPELRFSNSGTGWLGMRCVSNDRVREGDSWKDGPPTWVTIKLFGLEAEAAADTFKKGDRVVAFGDLKTSSWSSQDGSTRTTLELTAKGVGPSIKFGRVCDIQRTERVGGGVPASDNNDEEPF